MGMGHAASFVTFLPSAGPGATWWTGRTGPGSAPVRPPSPAMALIHSEGLARERQNVQPNLSRDGDGFCAREEVMGSGGSGR